jgi:hypothetical protein
VKLQKEKEKRSEDEGGNDVKGKGKAESNQDEAQSGDSNANGNVAEDANTQPNEAQLNEARRPEVPTPVSVFYFSSHKVFTSILDTPEVYGLSEGTIWMDLLHPTSATHVVLGGFVMEMLSKIPADPSAANVSATDTTTSTGIDDSGS